MRKTAIVFVATLFAFACKKESTIKQDPPPIDPGPVQTYQPHSVTAETYSQYRIPNSNFTYLTLTYDAQNRLTHRYDNGNPKVNYYFTYPDENTYTNEIIADTVVTWREFGMLLNGKIDSVLIISRYDINDTSGSIKYAYNAQNKVVLETHYQRSGTDWIPSFYYQYEYDAKGNLSKLTSPQDSTRYFYDTNKPNTLAPFMPFKESNPYLVSKEIYYQYGYPSRTYDHRYGFDTRGRVIADTSELHLSGEFFIYSYTY